MPDRNKSDTLVISIPWEVGCIWPVLTKGQAGPGLELLKRYPVHIEFQLEDDADAYNSMAFCDPILGKLQATAAHKQKHNFLIHDISDILHFVRSHSSPVHKSLTWFKCMSCYEQQLGYRVQVRVRGLSQQNYAQLRAMLALRAHALQDSSRKQKKAGQQAAQGASPNPKKKVKHS